MDSKNMRDVVDFVKHREFEEICVLSAEHKLIFSKMPFVLESLSSEASNLLDRMAQYQKSADVRNLNKQNVFVGRAEEALDNFKYQRLALHLEQSIKSKERRNDRDRRELDKFRDELRRTKEEMDGRPTMESVHREITSLNGKVLNYEKNFSDAKKKEERLDIKEEILPESFKSLLDELASLQQQRDHLKYKADNIQIARNSKKDLLKLKNVTKHV